MAIIYRPAHMKLWFRSTTVILFCFISNARRLEWLQNKYSRTPSRFSQKQGNALILHTFYRPVCLLGHHILKNALFQITVGERFVLYT